MNLEPIGLFARILFALLNWLGFQYMTNRRRTQEFVGQCLEQVERIILQRELPSDDLDYAHEIVKKLQDEVWLTLGAITTANVIAGVTQALYAARIYYWVRQYHGKPDAEIVEIIDERHRQIERMLVRRHSHEDLIWRIKTRIASSPALPAEIVEEIRQNCLADMAELKKLQICTAVSVRIQ